jgi:PBP1b-binding outer membrane lipoprotein LpoB
MNHIIARRTGAAIVTALALLLAGCSNQYQAPPPNGVPVTWGQQHYLDVQEQHRIEQQRRHRR